MDDIPEDDTIFQVSMQPTGGFKRLNKKGQCRLSVGPSGIRAMHSDYENELAVWKITDLRYYSFTPNTFCLEAGTRSKTGEGIFTFNTTDGKKICHIIEHQAKLFLQRSRRRAGEDTGAKNKQNSQNLARAAQGGNDYDNENVYSHLSRETTRPPPQTENVYGMASASAPISIDRGKKKAI